jgi:hypothetical protein
MPRPGQPEFLFTPEAFQTAKAQGAYDLSYGLFAMREVNNLAGRASGHRLQADPGDMTFIFTDTQNFREQSYSQSPGDRLFLPSGQLRGADYAPEISKNRLVATQRPVLEIPTDTFTGTLGPALARAIMKIPHKRANESLFDRIIGSRKLGSSAVREALRLSKEQHAEAIIINY